MTPANKRYVRRYLVGCAIYGVILTATTAVVRLFDLEGPVLVALSLLPALAIAGVMVVMGRYLLEETDEYVRRRVVIAMLFSIGVLISFTTAVGFLQQRGALGMVNLFWIFPAWCVASSAAEMWLMWRDRRSAKDAE